MQFIHYERKKTKVLRAKEKCGLNQGAALEIKLAGNKKQRFERCLSIHVDERDALELETRGKHQLVAVEVVDSSFCTEREQFGGVETCVDRA